jgi:allantoinase
VIASLQLSLSIIWTEASARADPLDDVARWVCSAPAHLGGLDRKGRFLLHRQTSRV